MRSVLPIVVVALGCGSTADDARDAAQDARTAIDAGATAATLPRAFDEGVTYDRELVVATDGADGAPGTRAQPLRTLREAVGRATPGTRVVVEAGTYAGATYLENVAGAAGRPIAVVGEGAVILDATGVDEALHVAQASYLVLENLELRNARVNGLNIDDGGSYDTPAHHLVLRNLRVHDVGTGGNNDCIKLSGVDDFFVLGSQLARCNAGDMIDQVGCHRGFIHGNVFSSSPGGGIQMKGGSADTLVHGNRFVEIRGRVVNAGGSTGLEFFRPIDAPHEAARLAVMANVIVRSGDTSGAAIAYVGCDACVFANNTLVEPRKWIARILQETVGARFVPSRDGVFVNNVIVFRTAQLDAYSWFNVGANTAPATFTLGSNLWFSLDDPTFSAPRLRDVPAETGSLVQRDPRLRDVAAGDARVPPTSPVRGAGRAAGVPADFDGAPYATPPSTGAYEAAVAPTSRAATARTTRR